MKLSRNLILSLLGLFIGIMSLNAQDPYACITKGAILEYANYGESENIEKYTRQVVVNVSDLSGGNYDLRIENSTINKPGQKKDGEDAYVTLPEIRNYNAMVPPSTMDDAASVIEGREVVMVPNRLAVGYLLPIGEVRLDMGGNVAVAKITENEIVGREELSTPAGTFKCYVMRQTIISTMLGIGLTTVTKTWISRGIGIVKQETTAMGRQVNRKELISYTVETKKGKK